MTAVPRLGARGLAALARDLTDRDHRVLRDVADFRLLSGQQLQHLHFGLGPTNARAARRCLHRLTSSHLLLHLSRRVGGVRAGSDGFIYALGHLGDRLLHPDRPRRRVGEVSDGFLDHTLAVAQLYVDLERACTDDGLRLIERQTEPTCWRRLPTDGSEWLKPDLLVVVSGRDHEQHSFVEVDRGTEHAPALTRKLRQYEQAYRLSVVGVTPGVFPQVVWQVPDEQRATLLVRLVERTADLTPELHLVRLAADVIPALTGNEVAS